MNDHEESPRDELTDGAWPDGFVLTYGAMPAGLVPPGDWVPMRNRMIWVNRLCECGGRLVVCPGCGEHRCPRCEPVKSDDCAGGKGMHE